MTESPTKTIQVKMKSFKELNDFVKLANKCTNDVIASSGRYIVSAKSVMGMHSLDVFKPIKVEFYGEIPDEVLRDIGKFVYYKDIDNLFIREIDK